MIIMPLYDRGPVPPRVTVDGVTLTKGDVIWRVCYGFITRNAVTSQLLRHWSRYEGCSYSTEARAIEAALAWNAKELKRAKQNVRRHVAANARLRARLKALSI